MNVCGKRIVLRALESQDLPLLHQWANDPGLAYGLGDIHFPSSTRQQEQWYERIQSDNTTIRLAIQATPGKLIGYTGFWNIHPRDRRAEHSVLIGDPGSRGLGFGRETILTCCRYAFQEMDLYRLDAYILENNAASLKSYQSCGFQVEGTLRGHAVRGGRRVARLVLGLLATDYAARTEGTDD
jgi:RimJ/RimL family protein N-acetyltransferase